MVHDFFFHFSNKNSILIFFFQISVKQTFANPSTIFLLLSRKKIKDFFT